MNAAKIHDVLLVGFGAVGAMYALILKRSGLVRVTIVARSNYDAVNNHGVRFESAKYGVITGWRPDRMVRSVEEAVDRPYSYVFVATKAVPERARIPSILQPLISAPYAYTHPQPTYVLLQNGLSVEVDLYHAIKQLGKEPSIISTALWINANMLEANIVEHGISDRVSIGMYRHDDYTTETNTAAEIAILEDIRSILTTGGSEITIVPEVQRKKFAKNFWNVAFSSCSALTGHSVSALFRPPPPDLSASYTPYVSPTTAHLIKDYTIPVISATLRELVMLARALGYPDSKDGIPSTLPDEVIEHMRQLHIAPNNSHKTSMLLDVEKGQAIEVEAILGSVVRLAHDRGVPVPVRACLSCSKR
ncbi:hypothetical protein H0H87_001500 [Tephrocybe sp. NHM501043]|nr:hypothetical protein H0H87_001500 [Tephrocybe sp. NHM501043]